MANINNKRKRPKIRLQSTVIAPKVIEEEVLEPILEEPTEEVEKQSPVEEMVVETPIEEVEETPVEELVEEVEETPVEETIEETDVEEVPLEMSEEEMQVALDEEGSLDGTAEEVEELANEEVEELAPVVEETPVEEPAPVVEETPVEEPAPVVEETPAEEPAPVVEETPVEEPALVVEETPVEEPAPVVEEIPVEEPAPVVEETPVEEPAPVVEETPVEEPAPIVEETPVEEAEEDAEEEKVEEAPKKDEFKLTAPQNLEEILANICTKRARKLIYRPADVIFSHTTTVLGTDKANDEKIKIKSILDAEIKQGVKLGYLDKFDGLKMSELKEEYENDVVYEYADQEFKRTGILLDGDKVKVYVYDWDLKACHHVGYIDEESANLVKPYIIDREKYSFDINGIIVGGKYKKIIKDEKSGKITVEKGNDGNLGLEIDINIIARKD
ncbi:MAG: hypothetical protein IKA99_00085 [Clostridia bacterium]|nr:hypothetical protein [Clostridia bacterium]